MKEKNKYDLMKKCPKFVKCNAPLCPLDPDVEQRVYVKGEPVCEQSIEIIKGILGINFESRYKKFIQICLEKEARFTPLTNAKTVGNLKG